MAVWDKGRKICPKATTNREDGTNMKGNQPTTFVELVQLCKKFDCRISDFALTMGAEMSGKSKDLLFEEMRILLKTDKLAVEYGLSTSDLTRGSLAGMNAKLLASDQHYRLLGPLGHRAICIALAIVEENARGKHPIVTCPTCGAAGVLPAIIIALGEDKSLHISEEAQVMSMFTARSVQGIIASVSSVSGAKHGCQAEIGSAAAMAAAACVELLGGTSEMCAHAVALVIKSLEGLVCDPVAGYVEIPCIKRNAFGAVTALASASMALAGIQSFIPVDEVLVSMKQIGEDMDEKYKETSKGGLAITKTAIRYEAEQKKAQPFKAKQH